LGQFLLNTEQLCNRSSVCVHPYAGIRAHKNTVCMKQRYITKIIILDYKRFLLGKCKNYFFSSG
jgi:hypothetical protein